MHYTKLKHRSRAFKRLNKRRERYHAFLADLAFVEYYEIKKTPSSPYIEEDVIISSAKRNQKRANKSEKN